MITPENLLKHELIGLDVLVLHSRNKDQTGIEGEVTDETRNTLIIDCRHEEKTIPKADATFLFTLPSGEQVRVDGELLLARPEDRIKKRVKKW